MRPNADWDELKEKLINAKIDTELQNAATKFLDEFAVLPPEPNTFNPHYIGFLITFLINDICSEEEVKILWWEMTLDLAKKWALDRGADGEPAVEAIEALIPLLTEHFDNDDSEITLEEVTSGTVLGIIMLSETLSVPKRFFVAPNANSLAQAHFSDNAWFRAIYAGRAPIGFVMLSVNEEEAKYMVWRLMIGEPYHGRGYGRKAMEAIKAHVRTLPNATELELSYGQGPGSPEGFYRKLGFEPTGKVEWGEVYARIDL